MSDNVENPPQVIEEEQDESWGDRMLLSDKPLTPRHRKLAELLAQGKTNTEISQILGYTQSRVSILKSNSRIKELAEKIRERVFEDTVGTRLKRLAEPALNEIERCLLDDTNRYKEQIKVEVAKWVLEKIDGKAAQKIDVTGSMLVGIMDKLDAMKTVGHHMAEGIIDVSSEEIEQNERKFVKVDESAELSEEEKRLLQWVKEV